MTAPQPEAKLRLAGKQLPKLQDVMACVCHRLDGVLQADAITYKRTMAEYFVRASMWTAALARLADANTDLQAWCAGTRALMEMCIDTLILHGSKDDQKARAAYVYEESQKLVAAKKLEEHFSGRAAPETVRPVIRWGRKNEGLIQQWRQEVWGHAGRVARWTSPSSKHSVIDDAKAVNEHYRCTCWTNVIENIHDSCAVTLDMLHWGTHGSGSAILRGEEADPIAIGGDILVNAVAMAKVIIDAMKCEAPNLYTVPAIRGPYEELTASMKELEDALHAGNPGG